ncbi:TetR/AcrR family transcriptional regulator [Gordonia sp. (in: high G+C Gram-positive bacteria)]|uniref:TetR/AcrR family transcriptional regulator n=1 Tax=Gordonia sp. (in: high G+C Gram-positive bacteria) TaxID=84139 RepID=UPI00169DC1B5|nr:TetR/AcrR family transcriptional regulator [Gordonia sp. (in: high G+C Gram-positive bacteria)]NLG45262.1 TetR/AcrR family transcriptional regulator [Gordonia sp. (in: high G+C Gram-positive bacteria)]
MEPILQPVTRRGRGRPPGPPLDLDKRRSNLLDAAEEAFRQNGSEVGLVEVAKIAGLSRSAVYAAFADRNALLDALAAREGRRIVDGLATVLATVDEPRAQTRAAVDLLADWFETEPVLAPLLMGRLSSNEREAGSVLGALVEILRAGFADRDGDQAAAEPWAHAIVGAVSSTIRWWSKTGTMSRTQVVDHLTDLIWSGFSDVSQRD